MVLLFFELLSGFYRVMTLLSLIQDRKSIIAFYTTAHSMSTEATDVVGVSEYVFLSQSMFSLFLCLLCFGFA